MLERVFFCSQSGSRGEKSENFFNCESHTWQLHAFNRIVPLSRHIPAIVCRINEIPLLKNIKIAHFLSPNQTLSSSKCSKMWLAMLGELATLPRPRSRLKRGAPYPITPSVGTSNWTLFVMSGNWVRSVMEFEPCFHSVTIVQAITLWLPLLPHGYS